MNEERLLRAAELTEKANPNFFSMRSLQHCVLHHCRYAKGFEELDRGLTTVIKGGQRFGEFTIFDVSSEFFGITNNQAEKLFGWNAKTKDQAVADIRALVARGKSKRQQKKEARKPKTAKGVAAVKKAIDEVVKTGSRVRRLVRA